MGFIGPVGNKGVLKIGVFFQEQQEQKKSTKPMIIIRWTIAILTVTLFVFGILNGVDFTFIKWILILVGIGSILDGIEKYLQNKSRKTYLVDFGFAFVWCALAFTLAF